MAERKPALVLGIGNTLMGDDGLGVRFAMAFEQRYELPPGVEVLDGGTGGLALLELIQDFASVVIIDAVTSDTAPGTILRYNGNELQNVKSVKRVTAHQIGLFELLETARFTGRAPSVRLIGIVPENVSAGTSLSDEIEKLTEPVTEIIADELKRLGIECKARPLPHA